MSIDVVMCFGVHARPYGAAVAQAVRSVPAVAGGLLEGCEVGVRTPARALLLRVQLSETPEAASVVDRLASSSARAHGFAVALRGDLAAASGAVADALHASDTLEIAARGDGLPEILERALASLWPGVPCASGASRLSHRHACAPRTTGRPASRPPRRHSPAGRSRSRSRTATS